MELAEYRRMADVEDTHWWYGSTRALLQELLDDRLPAAGRFLDVGCGTGATGAWLATRGALVAADFEPLALTLHRERHPESQVVATDARALPFPDASFDAVLVRDDAVPPLDRVAGGGRRRARHGSSSPAVCCASGSPACAASTGPTTVSPTPGAASRAADLVDMLTGSGFDVERATGAYSFLVPPAAVKTVVERGTTSSDLDRNAGGLGGTLSALATAERRLLRHVDLPAGLSVVAIGRRP